MCLSKIYDSEERGENMFHICLVIKRKENNMITNVIDLETQLGSLKRGEGGGNVINI